MMQKIKYIFVSFFLFICIACIFVLIHFAVDSHLREETHRIFNEMLTEDNFRSQKISNQSIKLEAFKYIDWIILTVSVISCSWFIMKIFGYINVATASILSFLGAALGYVISPWENPIIYNVSAYFIIPLGCALLFILYGKTRGDKNVCR